MIKNLHHYALAVTTLIVVIFSLSHSTPTQASATQFYVSPSGSDNNPGTLAEPFLTITKARDAVRNVNQSMADDIIVYLRGGTYTLTQTLTFNQSDSGMNGHQVIYKNYGNETPFISGGKVVSGWQQASGGMWKANFGAGANVRQMYVNGVRATRARTYGNLSGTTKNGDGWTTTDSDVDSWTNESDIEVVSNNLWKQFRCGIQSINSGHITVDAPCWINSRGNSTDPNDVGIDTPTWFENAFEMLDTPGEWYYNRSTGWIYYMPRGGENMSTANAVVPIVEKLVEGKGTPGSPLRNISFQGITFSYGTWLFPNTTEGLSDTQSNLVRVGVTSPVVWRLPFGNVTFSYVQNLDFSNNVLTHLGGEGLELGPGSKNNNIVGNVFSDISSNGLEMGDPNQDNPSTADQLSGNTINNNYVTNTAVEFQGASGMSIYYGIGTTIQHNEVSNLPASGIQVNYIFGTPNYSRDVSVQYNYVHDIMKTLVDGANIYMNGKTAGGVISDNLLTEINHSYGGIYLDDWCDRIDVYNNIIWNSSPIEWNPIKLKWNCSNVNVHDNWWRGDDRLWQGVDYGNADVSHSYWDDPANNNTPTSTALILLNYTTLTSLSQAPSSIVNNAGLESSYRYIKNISTAVPLPPPPAPVTPPATPATMLKGDINGDRIVNSLDWSLMNAKWFKTDSTVDLDGDGFVNSIDFSILNGNWLKSI